MCPAGPGCFVCPWAAARPLAVRAASFARRVVSKPGQAPLPPIDFARNSPAACSNIEFASLELQRFWGVSKNEHDKLRAKFGRRWCRCCPWAPWPGPVGQAACLSETPVTFAGAGRAPIETAVAFAVEKWVFLAWFSVAVVLPVSMVAVWGRALVMVVSRWSASAVAEVMAVSQLPRGCVLCAKKFALRGLMVGVSAKKFALHAQNTPKLAFCALLGELFRGSVSGRAVLGGFFRENASGGAVLGELFRGRAAGGAVLGEFFRGPAVVGSRGASCVAPWPW